MRDLKNKGFTLIELLVVIGIIAILFAIVLIAVNPARQFSQSRNATRKSHVKEILNAIDEYLIDNDYFPSGIDGSVRMIGTASSGCAANCGGAIPITDYSYDEESEFDTGNYSDTQWDDPNSVLELSSTGILNGSGEYGSEIRTASGITSWNTLSWKPKGPYGAQLPGNGATETIYSSGNINMTGNLLLWHLNETSGTIADSSGNGKTGSASGASYSSSGKFWGAYNFSGSGHEIVASSGVIGNHSFTALAWIKQSSSRFGGIIGETYGGTDDWGFLSAFSGNRARVKIVNSSGTPIIWDSTSNMIPDNTWLLVGVAYDSADGKVYFIKNDTNYTNIFSITGGLKDDGNALRVGLVDGPSYYFDGSIDEVSVFNRLLSPSEIQDIYDRGSGLSVKFQVRGCNDSACVGESFLGPDGTTSSYYTAAYSTAGANAFPKVSLTNMGGYFKYFQFKAFLGTDSASSPEISSVTINYGGVGRESAEDQCLDIADDLASLYIASMPEDPQNGSQEKTYYAVKYVGSNDRIKVYSCSAELDETIEVER